MGTGLQRPLVCKDCDGLVNEARLLMPVALASGPDGSIYIGDFNLIRKLTPDGHIFTVLQLRLETDSKFFVIIFDYAPLN